MNLKYRPDIDGLRAIAVISVIFYHAEISFNNINLFKGGYLGVDIFFVISGYLITSLIIKELYSTNNFSFLFFYERRIRRLIPTLLLVIFACIPISWFYLLPGDLEDFSKSILFTLAFVSNYFFHYSGLDYFDIDGLYKPLLHTWSLSIEEQYYIIFPILLVLLFKFLKNKIFFVLITLFVLNLLLVQFSGNLKFNYPFIENISDLKFNAPSVYFYKFYFITSRFWELLAGSLIVFFEIKYKAKHINQDHNTGQILSVLGILMIVCPIYFYDSNIYHPSIFTFIPVLGTCLIIWHSNKKFFIYKILSSKLFVGTRLISYSLYLWHYPLFAFKRINDFYEKSIYNDIVIFIILCILSVLTFKFIEKPARNKSNSFKNIIFVILLTITILIIFSFSVIKNNGYESRFKNYNIPVRFEVDNKKLKDKWKNFVNVTSQKITYEDNKINILFVGDSHAQDMLNVFYQNKNLFKNYDFMFDEFIFGYNNPSELFKKKIAINADVIFISYNFESRFKMRKNNDLKKDYNIKKLLDNFLNVAKQFNKKIVLSSNTNEYPDLSGYTLIDYVLKKDKDITKNISKYKKLYFDNREIHSDSDINLFLKGYSKKNNLIFLNKEDYLCNIRANECEFITPDGSKLYMDQNHYSINGAKYLGEKIYYLNWLKLN